MKFVFYFILNLWQKVMVYEKFGDMLFVEKNYVYVQKYYDFIVVIMLEIYLNGDGVKNKVDKLKDLVIVVEIVVYEDSLL